MRKNDLAISISHNAPSGFLDKPKRPGLRLAGTFSRKCHVQKKCVTEVVVSGLGLCFRVLWF